MGLFDFIPVVGDLIQAGTSLLTNNATNKNQAEMNAAQIQAQKDLQTSQNDWNEQMWQKNVDYNSPANQVKLYQQAGLNPAFFLGQGNSVSGSPAQSSSISAPPVPQPSGTYSDVPGALGKMGADFLNALLVQSEIEKNYSDAGVSKTEADFNKMTMAARARYQELLNGLNESQKNKLDEEVTSLKVHQSYEKAITALTNSQKEQTDIIVGFLPAMQMKQLEQLQADIRNKLSNASYNSAQIKYLGALKGLVAEQINTERHKQSNLDAQSDVYNSQVPLNNAQVGKIETETVGQTIDNEVQEDTKTTAKIGQNIRNIVSPVIEVVDAVTTSLGRSAASSVAKENANTNRMNANTKRQANSIKANQRVVKHQYNLNIKR